MFGENRATHTTDIAKTSWMDGQMDTPTDTWMGTTMQAT